MKRNNSFSHLHLHTEYSMLDGASKIDNLLTHIKSLGMNSVAITDHGFMFGAYEFWKKAKTMQMNPIIGLEAYATPGKLHRTSKIRVKFSKNNYNNKKDVPGRGAYTHITLLAKNTEGMHNLFRISSLASIEGYFYKPRVDIELLHTYRKGIIATTGCPSGEVQTRLRLGQYKEALRIASDMQDIFGKENYFCEIMDHGLKIEEEIRCDLHKLSNLLKIPLLATNDSHYVNFSDASAHAALLCVQSGTTLDDPKRFKFDNNEFYIKSASQMRYIFKDFPSACDNTLLIAEKCNVQFNESTSYMPRYPVPNGESEESWFIKTVEKGLHKRYKNNIVNHIRKRAIFEMNIISKMGFSGYFLVVSDFVNWAKSQNIRVGPGRGSGAGSIVAYALNITDIDPFKHGLIFERFLNPDRVSLPDFDIDFDENRRNEVIKYVTKKYGKNHTAMIVTYGTIKAKQSLKDAARVLGYPYSMGDKLTKSMPKDIMGRSVSLIDINNREHIRYKETKRFRNLINENKDLKKVFELAKGLEGLKRQWSVHAAGVILSSKPLYEILPLMQRDEDKQIITQFDYLTCESLGLMKMDFLGLKNLTIIEDALQNIKKVKNHKIDLENLPLNNKNTYTLLAKGRTLGVFQLDGIAIRKLLKLMKPDSFEDITAVLALYRPGPMGMNSHIKYALRKNNIQKINPIHIELEKPLSSILCKTYGLIIYQEQVMEVAKKIANFSLSQADILRRAMGKKNKVELEEKRDLFFSGMIKNKFSKEAALKLWNTLKSFSDYAFNKSHAAAYGMISYWTAYLKANYPGEYMAALLTNYSDDRVKLPIYLNECKEMNIKVLQPDINESSLNFSSANKNIRFGMNAIRNVGNQIAKDIIKIRHLKGRYISINDFINKISISMCNKKTIESIVKAGALDSLNSNRKASIWLFDKVASYISKRKKEEKENQLDLFTSSHNEQEIKNIELKIPINFKDWDKLERLNFERQMLGFYISDHPFSSLKIDFNKIYKKLKHSTSIKFTTISSLLSKENIRDGDNIFTYGIISNVKHKISKRTHHQYAQIDIEDINGQFIEIMFFGFIYQSIRSKLKENLLIFLEGVLRGKDNSYINNVCIHVKKCYISNISDISKQPNKDYKNNEGDHKLYPYFKHSLIINLPEIQLKNKSLINKIKNILKTYPGNNLVYLNLINKNKTKKIILNYKIDTGISSEIFSELKEILGPKSISLL